MLDTLEITDDQKAELEIPQFLKRKGQPMTHAEHSAPKDTPELPQETVTLEMLMEQIKKLSAKKDELQTTITALKKQAQRLVGAL